MFKWKRVTCYAENTLKILWWVCVFFCPHRTYILHLLFLQSIHSIYHLHCILSSHYVVLAITKNKSCSSYVHLFCFTLEYIFYTEYTMANTAKIKPYRRNEVLSTAVAKIIHSCWIDGLGDSWIMLWSSVVTWSSKSETWWSRISSAVILCALEVD